MQTGQYFGDCLCYVVSNKLFLSDPGVVSFCSIHEACMQKMVSELSVVLGILAMDMEGYYGSGFRRNNENLLGHLTELGRSPGNL